MYKSIQNQFQLIKDLEKNNKKYLSVWYKYTSLKYNYFKVRISDPTILQSSVSIWLMQNNMWYSILSLLIHVDFRLNLDLSWLPLDFRWTREYDDLRPRPEPTSSGIQCNVMVLGLPSWMTTSGIPGLNHNLWPLTIKLYYFSS